VATCVALAGRDERRYLRGRLEDHVKMNRALSQRAARVREILDEDD
jgi:hypothetical protein